MADKNGIINEIPVVSSPVPLVVTTEATPSKEPILLETTTGKRQYNLDFRDGFLKKGRDNTIGVIPYEIDEYSWGFPELITFDIDRGLRQICFHVSDCRVPEELPPAPPSELDGNFVSGLLFHASSGPIKYANHKDVFEFAGILETKVTIPTGVANRKISVLAPQKEKVRVLSISASQYNPAVGYKFGVSGPVIDLDAPQIFMGPGQMDFISEFSDIYVTNQTGNDVEFRVLVIWK